jgi:beta-glucosidase
LAVILCLGCGLGTAEEAGPEAAAAVHPEIWPQLKSPVAPDPEIEEAISDLLGKMSLDEKVGQVIQPEINSVTPEEVKRYRLGSVLNGGGGWPGTNKYSKPEDWLALADAFWEASMDTSEGGHAIPILWGLDAVHGHNNVIGATLFPHNVGLGATNNPELLRKIGKVTAREVAITGQDWDFGPTIAVARDDRWGRAYESYSEDPEIVRAYARAMVEGLQGKAGSDEFLDGHHLISTAKHFLGDGGTEGGKDQGENLSTEEELRDIHGAGYVTAIEAGVQTVMASYNSWHGKKMHGNKALLTEVLKGQMSFDGFVVGDWNGHGQVAGCSNESCAAAFNAGVDMFMVPQDWKALYENTLAQVESGEISTERLDDAVRRILRVKMRAGLFERGKPSSRPLGGKTELLGSPEHRAVARQAVRESLVLLKNNGKLLPLAPDTHVLVAGDGADNIGKQTGGWTITWQGTENTNEDFPGATSIWAGIRETVEAAGGRATLSPDGSFDEKPDVAIVVFGEDPYAEFQGDRDWVDYSLGDDSDLELLKKLEGAGVPVVSVFITGRPLWVNPELNASDAFVVAWLPGTEGGGVADVLFRAADGSVRHEFTGKLSFSWPKLPTQAVLNRNDPDYDPLFPYGYGLTSADEIEVGELSEEAAGLPTFSRTVYFEQGPVYPWQLYVGDPVDWRVPADTPVTTTRNSDNLVVEVVDREGQGDARAARWSGGGMAAVYLQASDPVDLSRESNGEMAISFDIYPDEAPGGAVVLRVDGGEDLTRGTVDVTAMVTALPLGEWSRVAVRLRCFEDAGTDMKKIHVPFGLASEGSLALRFADVKIVSAAESEATCP